MQVLLTLVAVFFLAPLAAADSLAIKPYACRGYPGFDSQRELVVAAVKALPAGRTYFFDDAESCPYDAGKCRRKAYLVSGDRVIVDNVADQWACATFVGAKDETTGYIATKDLEFLPKDKEPELGDWVGTWESDPDSLEFSIKGGKLQVSGNALWDGGRNDAGDEIVHTGDIEGELEVQSGGKASLPASGEYECAADFQLLAGVLLVKDNGNCGGMNVNFNGVYRKKVSRKPKQKQQHTPAAGG